MTPDQVRNLRKRIGLTQKQLAEELRVSANTVARWEGGIRSLDASSVAAMELLEAKFLTAPGKVSRDLAWDKISDDKIFQRLVNHLMAQELPLYIPSSPDIGADGGWDGFFEGSFLGLKGKWCIQDKHTKHNLTKAYGFLKDSLLGTKSKKGEIKKALENNVDFLLVVTNAELSIPIIQKLEGLKRGKLKKIIIWDRETLSIRIIDQPWVRFYFFKDPQFPMLSPPSSYFEEFGKDLISGTIGRSIEIENALNEIMKSNSDVLIISAPGGFGKSHFLRELAIKLIDKKTEWKPWFIRPGTREPKEVFQDEINKERKYVLFLDDADKFPEVIEPFIAFVKSFPKNVRLVIGIRNAGIDVINDILKKFKLYSRPSTQLPELTQEQQIELLKNSSGGKPIKNPERIVKELGGVPYYIVQVGKQLGGGKGESSGQQFLSELVENFMDECRVALKEILELSKINDLIFECSVLVPFNRKDKKTAKIVAEILKIDEDLLEKCLTKLCERQIFRVIGNSYRFKADMLSDLCLRSRIAQPDGNVFVQKAMKIWLKTEKEKVIVNLAAASIGDEKGAAHKIIQELVRQWSSDAPNIDIFERQERLKMLRSATFLAPDQILDLIISFATTMPAEVSLVDGVAEEYSEDFKEWIKSRSLDIPNMDDYGPLLESMGSIPGYAVQVAPVSLNLFRKTLKGTYGNFKLQGLFSSLVDPFSHSTEDIKQVIDYLFKECNSDTPEPLVIQAFTACATELLRGSHQYNEFYGIQFTYGQRTLPAIPQVIEMRQYALERCLKMLHHPSKESRLSVIKVFEEHGNVQPYYHRDIPLKERISEEKIIILTELRERLKNETDFEVLSAIESFFLKRWAMEEEVKSIIAEALISFDSRKTPLYMTYRYYRDPEEAIEDFKSLQSKAPTGNRWSWWVQRERFDFKPEDLAPLAKSILLTCPTTREIVKFLVELEGLIKFSKPWPYIPLIEAIDLQNPDFCNDVRRSLELWKQMPERFKTSIDEILSKRIATHIEVLAKEIFAKKELITLEEAKRFLISLSTSGTTFEQKRNWIDNLIDIGNEDILNEISLQCRWGFGENYLLTVTTLIKLLEKADINNIYCNMALALHKIPKIDIPYQKPVEALKNLVKQKLLQRVKIDHYDEELSEFAFRDDLNGFLTFIKDRLTSENEIGLRRDFEAVPFNGFNFLNDLVKSGADLEKVLQLAYKFESEKPIHRYSLDYFLKPVLYKSFNGEKPYIIKSCEDLLEQHDYKSVHKELWWRLGNLTINAITDKILLKAIKLAEKNGLLEDVTETVWKVMFPNEYGGTVGAVPMNLATALDLAKLIKADLPAGRARTLIEKIEQSLCEQIEWIQNDHEEFLNRR